MGDHSDVWRSLDGGTQGKLTRATEALYWQAPAAKELAALGLCQSDFAPPEVELWPENWPAIQLFTQLSTQWRIGPSGPVGLDYNVVFHELDRRQLGRDDYDDMMGAIRTIEEVALKALSANK